MMEYAFRQSFQTSQQSIIENVAILVMMEYAFRQNQKLESDYDEKSRNPCYDGICF